MEGGRGRGRERQCRQHEIQRQCPHQQKRQCRLNGSSFSSALYEPCINPSVLRYNLQPTFYSWREFSLSHLRKRCTFLAMRRSDRGRIVRRNRRMAMQTRSRGSTRDSSGIDARGHCPDRHESRYGRSAAMATTPAVATAAPTSATSGHTSGSPKTRNTVPE